jgi:phage-related protein
LRKIVWAGSSYDDLIRCPEEVKDDIGYALELAQRGLMADYSRPMKGDLRDVVEIRTSGADGIFRAMYTTTIGGLVYVLDVFNKKAKRGIETPQADLDRIKGRLKRARERHERTT